MPVEPSVRNIGAFHFGDCNKLDPVRSLDEALKKIPADRLKETLLVLPEAFNVRNGYYKTPQEVVPRSIEGLQVLSTNFNVRSSLAWS
jgi:hypothetical protein